MKKIIAAIVVIVIIVIAGLAFRGNNKGTSSNAAQQTSNQNSSGNNQSAQPTSTDQVTIQNFAFSPADITVKKGTKVTWTNQDSTQHTVTENDGKNGPSAPPLDNGKSYSFTFNETGSFHYHCSIHPEMTGTVTVTD